MMTDAPAELALAAEFPPSNHHDWLELVTTALKGASFDQRLVSHSYDGLRIEPLYARAATASAIVSRPAATPWQAMARIELPDAAEANAVARHELENGAAGLALAFAGAIGSYGFGLDASAPALSALLDGIHLDAGIALECDCGARWNAIAPAIAAAVERTAIAPAAADIRFGIDPLGAAAVSGRDASWPSIAPNFAATIKDLVRRGFRGPFAAADGRPVHAAGGSEALELAFALASAIAYLRALEAAGVALEAAPAMIFFRLAADADQFLTMAKFRALRRLWARVEAACGLAPHDTFIAAETAWRMMTRRDPAVNMLRTTMAAFAAGVAGANAVTILPFTTAIGLADRFARRLARNTQLILIEESNLAKVADPAAGSGALEQLTGDLCTAAWARLQTIERAGGAATALACGVIQREVAAVRAARAAAVAYRRDGLTGTSEFPNLSEAPSAVLVPMPPPTPPDAQAFEPLAPARLAEPYERLRDKSDSLLAATGARPKMFLATLGPLAAFSARASFAKNLFEAGGIEAHSGEGYADLAAMVAAFRASGTKLACLCSGDESYAAQALAAATALRAAGATALWLAGRPGAIEDALRAAGVERFIVAGGDALATLEDVYGLLA